MEQVQLGNWELSFMVVQVLPGKHMGSKHYSHQATLPGNHQPHPAAPRPVLAAAHIFWWALKVKQKEKWSWEEDLASWRDTTMQACCGGALAWSCWGGTEKLFGPWVVGMHLIHLDGRSWNRPRFGQSLAPSVLRTSSIVPSFDCTWMLTFSLACIISDFQFFVVFLCICVCNIFIYYIFIYTLSI